MGTPEGTFNSMPEIADVISEAALKSSPGVAVGAVGQHMHLSTWVYGITIVYLICQLIVIAPKVWRTLRK